MSFPRLPALRRCPARGRAPHLATIFFALSAVGAAVVGAVPAQAGTIHPAVQDELSRLSLTDEATVLFVLEEQADVQGLNNALKTERATRQERHRRVIEELQRVAAASQGPLLAELEARRARGEISGYTPYWISNLIVVRGMRQTIEQMAVRADIGAVEPQIRTSLIEPVGGVPQPEGDGGPRGIGVTPGQRAIRATEVWYELGITGEGALVANMDTGVDGNHPALQDRWRGNHGHAWQECWLDALGGGSQYPVDYGSHGTHVMGTITGLGAATQDTIGTSWGSLWIACNPINQGVGGEFDNDVINSFQWLADPDGNPNTVDDVPDVVQNSWRINEGFGGNYTDCDSRWWAVIDNCEAAGVVVTFSAGNEGPGAQTIGSPSDRATTALNVFSVGAVDATSYNWPYPIASWSSRGPTGCNVPAELKIKPEISAPGVDVYSSVPGGGYQQNGWSGTSMAGPHVAGVVGLMRSANPDLDVETIKQILLDTARDEGPAGEDNTYGWGFIDAYEAVLRTLQGYGSIAGTITNGSNGGTGVPLAQVRLVEIDRSFTANELGDYSGLAPQNTYTVEVSHPSFQTESFSGITIVEDQVTTLDATLTDIGDPAITGVVYPQSVQDPEAPLSVTATITDFSAFAATEVVWRVDGGSWNTSAMSALGDDRYEGLIQGQPIGSLIEFYIRAEDVAGNEGVNPAGAPAELYQVFVVLAFFADDAETDQGWTLFQSGDTQSGRWVRHDPYGTVWNGNQVEPADDHTPDPGVNCFVTGAGIPGGSAGISDVDNGCVTLTSPVVDLGSAEEAIVTYWRWVAMFGPLDASFEASVSSDNGATWTTLESLAANENTWRQRTFDLTSLVALTTQMRFRFVACDFGSETLLEAAIDDFEVQGVPTPPTSVEPGDVVPATRLYANRPNPFSNETTIRFALASAQSASLTVYDAAGRRVRTLVSGPLAAGEHATTWNGRDEAGHPVSAGVYFYDLEVDGQRAQRKMLLLK